MRRKLTRGKKTTFPVGATTQQLRFPPPNSIAGMAFGARNLKYVVLEPSGTLIADLLRGWPGVPDVRGPADQAFALSILRLLACFLLAAGYLAYWPPSPEGPSACIRYLTPKVPTWKAL